MLMNLPNALTLVRFLLVGVYVFFYFNEGLANNEMWAFLVFLLAGLTDILDGEIARRHNQITKWGKMMDPLADKLMLMTVLICLFIDHRIPLWAVSVVVLKELLMIFGVALLYGKKKVVVQSNFYGKFATVLFYVAITALVFDFLYAKYILWAAIASTVVSSLQYAYSTLIKKKEMKEQGEVAEQSHALKGQKSGRSLDGERKQGTNGERWNKDKDWDGKLSEKNVPLEQSAGSTGKGD